MSMDRCPNCGASLKINYQKKEKYCEYCGTSFSMEEQEHTVRYIDEARLKEAELKEKMFDAQQRELKKEEQQAKKNKKLQIAAIVITVLAVISLFSSGAFSSVRWFILAAILYAFSKRKSDGGRRRAYDPGDRYVSDKDKVVALLLCLFLGMIGAHHFYVGRIGKGILYIFTCGLFGIGILVDLILIISGKYKDSKGRTVL